MGYSSGLIQETTVGYRDLKPKKEIWAGKRFGIKDECIEPKTCWAPMNVNI